jgi:hypothetical protein
MHTSDIEGADKYRLSGHKGPKAVCIQKGVCFQKVETSPGTEVSEKIMSVPETNIGIMPD